MEIEKYLQAQKIELKRQEDLYRARIENWRKEYRKEHPLLTRAQALAWAKYCVPEGETPFESASMMGCYMAELCALYEPETKKGWDDLIEALSDNYWDYHIKNGPPPFCDFYMSPAWQKVRYNVLAKSNGLCCLCGRDPITHGVALHVDHIIPRSKNKERELDEDNLQVLCEDCNLGKSNRDETDWRCRP